MQAEIGPPPTAKYEQKRPKTEAFFIVSRKENGPLADDSHSTGIRLSSV